MTKSKAKDKKSPTVGLSRGQAAFCAVSVLTLALTYLHYECAVAAMSRAVNICLTSLIPSLFPFMVLSELTLSSGAGEVVSRAVGAPFSRLFGISRAGANAFVLGSLCGFPIGTRAALSLYDRGEIDGRELSHLLCFCNTQSPAFVVGSVGVGLFGSKKFGLCLLACDLFSSILLGVVFRLRFRESKKSADTCALRADRRGRDLGFCQSLSAAVRSSSEAMLSVCAFVIFFSGIGAIVGLYLQKLSPPPVLLALLRGSFELTGGIFSLAEQELPLTAAPLCAAAMIGWSGLSIHFQLVSICADRRVELTPYFLSKLMRAILDAALVASLLRVCPLTPLCAQTSLALPSLPSPLVCFFTLVFILSLPTIALFSKNK